MSSWARRRQFMYGGGFFLVIFLIIVIFSIFLFYKQPTCSDRKQNGVEEGIDCGGSCPNLCSVQVLNPIIHWARAIKTKGNVYNLVASVENPNTTSRAINVGYIFKIYDRSNSLIGIRPGVTFLPARQTTAVFEENFVAGSTTPTRVTFEFSGSSTWKKLIGRESKINIENISLTGEKTAPRLQADIFNPEVIPMKNIEFVGLVYDANENVIATSRTFIDSLSVGEKSRITFTWPEPIDAGEGRCEIPVDVVLAIDRSGSMSDDGKNPPQPLTDVKNAASAFISELKNDDQVGVLSFANSATIASSSLLSNKYSVLQKEVQAISIFPDTAQNTNIADAFIKAKEEFDSSRHNANAGKVLVLLTDGAPTLPKDPSNKNDKFPEEQAVIESKILKDNSVSVYAIGLGAKINADFLKTVVDAPEHFYSAVSVKDLKDIYTRIATSICKKSATTIDILPHVDQIVAQ